MRQTDFVLMLHSHLPYVLNHGRWPHGSDWICEAAIETYLPLLATLRRLESENVAAPLSVGFTPILANMLEHPTFAGELEAYFRQRFEFCAEAPASMSGTADEALLPLVGFWERRLRSLHELWQSIGGDILGPFREMQDRERIELTSSAATHGFLPLLARDESIHLQLAVGRSEHHRLFGRDPEGCWVPECAYSPRGPWAPLPGAPGEGRVRAGVEEHLAEAGYRYFFVDSHMARAGSPLGVYGQRFGAADADRAHPEPDDETQREYTPYQAYRVSDDSVGREVAAFVRDPRSSQRVWNRHGGYPGDGAYLEFHKIRWPGGLRLWRVTSRTSDLGEKRPYDPAAARQLAGEHARDFASLIAALARGKAGDIGAVVVAPFDTELFGHWWFEGPDFLADLYTALPDHTVVRPVTAGEHLDSYGTGQAIRLARGSWGRNGDWSMWMNGEVEWTWPVIWQMENAFWDLAPTAIEVAALEPVLAQAARTLLLLQASDWQFIISTGEVEDYAIRRFNGHADDLRELLGYLVDGLAGVGIENALLRAGELQQRDDVFRDIITSLRKTIAAGRRRGRSPGVTADKW
ncbi:MAG: 1,4-alpha-glucan branching protein domain-containing protein [Gemmatimonadota bacterium]